MTNDALVLVLSCAVVLFGALGYLLGRHEAYLYQVANKLRTLGERQSKLEAELNKQPEQEKPAVTPGVYVPAGYMNKTNPRKAGLVEAKTPQQVEWEARREITKLEQGQV